MRQQDAFVRPKNEIPFGDSSRTKGGHVQFSEFRIAFSGTGHGYGLELQKMYVRTQLLECNSVRGQKPDTRHTTQATAQDTNPLEKELDQSPRTECLGEIDEQCALELA